MRILLHAGVHPTDEDKLFASLDLNGQMLSKQNIALPRFKLYRRPLRQAMLQVDKSHSSHEMRVNMINSILQNSAPNPNAIILSMPLFFGSPRDCVSNNQFFPQATTHLERFCSLFNEDEIEIFISIRNPATFIPAAMSIIQTTQMNDILRGSNYMALRWSELFDRIRGRMPSLKITAWCDEDTPFIWAQILRRFASAPQSQAVANAYALFAQILSQEGFERFKSYMQSHPDMNPMQRRKVMYAFAEKFARTEAIEQDLSGTPWDQQTIDRLTEQYDYDVDRIASMPGVTFIEP